jgi:polysaccharide pyruvyl transferase WcaK-like protein
MPVGVYVGWVGRANMGDEALWSVCRQRFSQIHWDRFDQPAFDPEPTAFLKRATRDGAYFIRTLTQEFAHLTRSRALAAVLVRKMRSLTLGEVGMLGGGTLINEPSRRYFDGYVALRRRTHRPVPVFGTGVAAPEVWTSRGKEWRQHCRDWVDLLSELPVVGVRGPASKQLLEEAGATNVVISGDPAVWLHHAFEGRCPGLSRDAEPKKRIGINCGDTPGFMWGNRAAILEQLGLLVRHLLTEGHSVELFAVWPEDLRSCEEVARSAGIGLSRTAPALLTPEAFLRRVVEYDLVIALKLHAGILAAAANVPFIQL